MKILAPLREPAVGQVAGVLARHSEQLPAVSPRPMVRQECSFGAGCMHAARRRLLISSRWACPSAARGTRRNLVPHRCNLAQMDTQDKTKADGGARKLGRAGRPELVDPLEDTRLAIENRFGRGSIIRLGSTEKLFVDALSTGSIALDLAIGVGGVPRGRITEIFGPEMSGKTTVCLHVLAEAQRRGGGAAFIDVERTLNPAYAQACGVNVDELLVSQPDTGEEALEITDMLIRSGRVACVVVDSVAALVPRAEFEGEMGDSFVGMQAKLMSQSLRKLAGALSHSNTALVFTNQLREAAGVMFGNPEKTPGGRALKFYASVRLDMRRIETIKSGTDSIGNRVRVKVVKNNLAAPFRLAEFDVMFGEGISREGELLDVGVASGVVSKTGGWFNYGGGRIGKDREQATKFLKADQDVAQRLEAEIRERIATPERPASSIRPGPRPQAPPRAGTPKPGS
jgi:recombination protein RecA